MQEYKPIMKMQKVQIHLPKDCQVKSITSNIVKPKVNLSYIGIPENETPNFLLIIKIIMIIRKVNIFGNSY